MPVLEWQPTHNGHGCIFVAGRRMSDDIIWTRSTAMIFPNLGQVPSLFSSAHEARYSTSCMSRWHVPVDDENCILFGWRHFNDQIDQHGDGSEEECGYDKIDFLDGQVGNRSYDEGQRAPGDWEAITNQRTIAVHGLENPGYSDGGVYLARKLLREAARGEAPPDTSRGQSADGEQTRHSYAKDVTLRIPRRDDPDEDRELIVEIGRKVCQIIAEADAVDSKERRSYILARLDELDGGLQDAAE